MATIDSTTPMHFVDDCKRWKDRTVTTKTWAEFIIFFTKAYNEYADSPESMRAAGIANNAEQLQNNQEELKLVATVLQDHEESIANQNARYEEQGLLLATVREELKQQQQANNVSYQRAGVSYQRAGGAPAYRPPSMRNQTQRTRFTVGHNNGDHAIPANEHGRQYNAAMANLNWQRHQPAQRQQGCSGGGRGAREGTWS